MPQSAVRRKEDPVPKTAKKTSRILRNRALTRSRSSPFARGLSHIGEEGEEEGWFPGGAFDFASQRGFGVGMGTQDIECEASQDGEVGRSIVLPGSVAI